MIVKFNKETSELYEELEGDVWVIHFLNGATHYFSDLFASRGYLYYNEIYEELKIKWDPHKENVALIHDENAYIWSKVRKAKDGGFEIEFKIKYN